MTRDELIEAMAMAHARAFTATKGDTRRAIVAAMSAIEAAGYIVVPKEATEAMERAGWDVEELQTPGRVWSAMIAARPRNDKSPPSG